MVYYGVSEGRIKRIIRHPTRIEEGIAPNTIAVMQPVNIKKKQEIWIMYQTNRKSQIAKRKTNSKIKIISVWRYPGISPKRNPIPEEILQEIRRIMT